VIISWGVVGFLFGVCGGVWGGWWCLCRFSKGGGWGGWCVEDSWYQRVGRGWGEGWGLA